MTRATTIKMCRVSGVDSFGKKSFWSDTGYWVDESNAGWFTRYKAEQIVRECNIRNRYLDSYDRVEAQIED